MPPLEIDRSVLIAARIKSCRGRMMRARTALTVTAALAALKADREIPKKDRDALQEYAALRIARLSTRKTKVI